MIWRTEMGTPEVSSTRLLQRTPAIFVYLLPVCISQEWYHRAISRYQHPRCTVTHKLLQQAMLRDLCGPPAHTAVMSELTRSHTAISLPPQLSSGSSPPAPHYRPLRLLALSREAQKEWWCDSNTLLSLIYVLSHQWVSVCSAAYLDVCLQTCKFVLLPLLEKAQVMQCVSLHRAFNAMEDKAIWGAPIPTSHL